MSIKKNPYTTGKKCIQAFFITTLLMLASGYALAKSGTDSKTTAPAVNSIDLTGLPEQATQNELIVLMGVSGCRDS